MKLSMAAAQARWDDERVVAEDRYAEMMKTLQDELKAVEERSREAAERHGEELSLAIEEAKRGNGGGFLGFLTRALLPVAAGIFGGPGAALLAAALGAKK